MNLKKILLIIILIAIIGVAVYFIAYSRTKTTEDNGKPNIIVTNFAAYDFTRQVAGGKFNIDCIIPPGQEVHSYELTSADRIDIENSDLFIYVGGETEVWVEEVLPKLDTSKAIKLMNTVDLIEEKEVDDAEAEEEEHGDEGEGHEEETAYDEHIWTSPENAMKIVESIALELGKLDEENKQLYIDNANSYIAQIKEVQSKIREIVDNRVRDRLIMGDRMPLQYFIEEFGLEVSAAFSGCSTQTDPSTATIASLVDRVKKENVPVVLYKELGNSKVARIIAEETNTEIMEIQTIELVSKQDFDNGESYVSLMTRNLEVLKKALQ